MSNDEQELAEQVEGMRFGDTAMLHLAEEVNRSLRQMSDVMQGAVKTLMAEGWTEEQSRELTVAMFVGGLRGRTTKTEKDGES